MKQQISIVMAIALLGIGAAQIAAKPQQKQKTQKKSIASQFTAQAKPLLPSRNYSGSKHLSEKFDARTIKSIELN